MIATFVRRKNLQGKKCVAPYIDGLNVWDIPEKEWTPAVQQAIAHAWWLGMQNMRHTMSKAGDGQYASMHVDWLETKNELR